MKVSNLFSTVVKDEVVKEGDIIDVKVLEVNDRGQIKLSHKATLTPAPAPAHPSPPPSPAALSRSPAAQWAVVYALSAAPSTG